MHGRLKVRTTEEQKQAKLKEQQKKLCFYRAGMKTILNMKKDKNYGSETLKLSTQILVLNPDIYTLWNYRKEFALSMLNNCKSKIAQDSEENDEFTKNTIEFFDGELAFTEQCLLTNPKSYGTWHHRYWILENHPKPNWSHEFQLCTKYLTYDDRNLHCWDYRRLVVNKVGVSVVDELTFSTERINVNFSNYSAWHYRSTLPLLNEHQDNHGDHDDDSETIRKELKLVESAIFTDPYDSSAWFYLRWLTNNKKFEEIEKSSFLNDLKELELLEPQCKWILIAKCWIVYNGTHNTPESNTIRKESWKKLCELDPVRIGRYSYYLNKLK